MNDPTERSEWHVVWPAVVLSTLLLAVTFAFGYELLHGWMFTVALLAAATGGLGLVASALWPRSLRAFWTARCPAWVALALPVGAALAVRWTASHPTAARARLDAVLASADGTGHAALAIAASAGHAALTAARAAPTTVATAWRHARPLTARRVLDVAGGLTDTARALLHGPLGHVLASARPALAAGRAWVAARPTVAAIAGTVLVVALASLVVRSRAGRRGALGPLSASLPLWVQPPLAAAGAFAGYLLAAGEFRYVVVTFLVAMTLFSLYVWVMLPLAVIDRHREAVEFELRDPAPTVSVLVPAYNERESIGRCVESILAADYPDGKLSVFVIDDGSTDGTYERASEFGDRVTVLRKENGGKYSALNYGLLCSESEIVVSVDADSVLEPDAIARSVAKLQANDDLAAIASNVKVENRDRALTKLQALEYIIGINMFRRAFALFGAVPVVPGCLGAFRRDALDAIDGYDPDTVTEDYDLTIQLLKSGRSVGTTEAVVWTEAPFTWRDFYAQRRRWTQGGLQTLYKHVDVLVSPETGFLHRFVYPLKVVSLLRVVPLYPAIAYVILFRSATHFLVLMLFFGAIMALIATTAIAFEGEDVRLLAYFPFLVVGYRQFLDLTLLRSVVALVIGRRSDWGEIRRAARGADTNDLAIHTTDTTDD